MFNKRSDDYPKEVTLRSILIRYINLLNLINFLILANNFFS